MVSARTKVRKHHTKHGAAYTPRITDESFRQGSVCYENRNFKVKERRFAKKDKHWEYTVSMETGEPEITDAQTELIEAKLKKHDDDPEQPRVGIIRLDYDYPVNVGDVDDPCCFDYPVHYRVVKGLTFKVCQSGRLKQLPHKEDEDRREDTDVEANFKSALKFLVEDMKVSVVGSDCGFFLFFQNIARKYIGELHKANPNLNPPVCMSSLCLLPSLLTSQEKHEKVIVMTANAKNMTEKKDSHNMTMVDVVLAFSAKGVKDRRLVVKEDKQYKDYVAAAKAVPYKKVSKSLSDTVKRIKGNSKNNKTTRVLLESTEMNVFKDIIQKKTGLPVYDTLDCLNFYMHGALNNNLSKRVAAAPSRLQVMKKPTGNRK